jgi:hypothetical protein
VELIVVTVAMAASDKLIARSVAEKIESALGDMNVVADVRITEGINVEVDPDGEEGTS